MMSIDIRTYRATDDAALKRGFDSAFGLDRSIEELHWKFFIWSRARQPLLSLAWEDGEIVGGYGAVRSALTVGGRPLELYQSVDNFVLRRYRNGALYRDLFRHFWSHFPPPNRFIFGFPGARSFGFGQRKLGYRIIEPMNRYQLSLADRDPSTAAESIVDGFSQITIRPLPPLDTLSTHAAELDELGRKVATLYPIVGEKGMRHLECRYLRHPTQRFILREARSAGGTLLGYGVASVLRGKDGTGVGRIYELLAPESQDAEVLLLEQLLNAMRSGGAELALFYTTALCRSIPTLEALGFLQVPSDDFCLAMVSDDPEAVEQLGRAGQWCCTLGDTDL